MLGATQPPYPLEGIRATECINPNSSYEDLKFLIAIKTAEIPLNKTQGFTIAGFRLLKELVSKHIIVNVILRAIEWFRK